MRKCSFEIILCTASELDDSICRHRGIDEINLNVTVLLLSLLYEFLEAGNIFQQAEDGHLPFISHVVDRDLDDNFLISLVLWGLIGHKTWDLFADGTGS